MPSLAAACTRAPALFLVDARGTPSTPAHSLHFPSLPLALSSLPRCRPPWPAGQPRCRRVLAAPSLHGRSHVHHRLCLVVLHLARTLIQAIGHRSTIAGKPPWAAPPVRVAKQPRATFGRARDAHGRARARRSCSTHPPPPPSLLRPATASPAFSSAVFCDQGPRAQIRRRSRA